MDHVSMLHAELGRELGRISQLEGEREILGRRTLKLEAELAAEKNAHEADCKERDRRWAMAKEANERVAVLESELAAVRKRNHELLCAADVSADEIARLRAAEPVVRHDLAAIRDAEEYAARMRKRADEIDSAMSEAVRALREQNAELRALLTEALRRHDATPLGEWARAARALVADEHANPTT